MLLLAVGLTLALWGQAVVPVYAQEADSGVIRLGGKRTADPEPVEQQSSDSEQHFGGARRGFDYDAFRARLETYWFQRKAFLAHGRDGDADRQAELIRAFCLEEGVSRLEGLSSALISEAKRYMREGDYAQARKSLDLAEAFDPGRPQIAVARAALAYESGLGYLTTAGEFARALRLSVLGSASNMTLLNQLAIVLLVALLASIAVFALLMIYRYQVPFRHEVEEWMAAHGKERFGPAAGWALLLLPFLLWIAAGWVVVYWLVLTFRYMRRSERLATVTLLLGIALAVPGYRVAIALYGVTADPVVRTTLASAGGSYAPDRIVRLRQLVERYPDDPIYRFLLAGLYKNGRYFEEAFAEYKQVLDLEPSIHQAHINIGNIFYLSGQHAEASAAYTKALELQPGSPLALYNLHLAQSETFHFKDAEVSLAKARNHDAEEVTRLMTTSKDKDGRPMVADAEVQLGAIWQAALEGRGFEQRMELQSGGGVASMARRLVNPVSIASLLAMIACVVVGIASAGSDPARRCIRCGRPFCHMCKSRREGHEYCSQCLHLFVIGDGLAPETKTRKLYEVDRHERRNRTLRKLLSFLLPGSAHLLRGRSASGCVLILLWIAALISWQPSALVPLEQVAGADLRLDLLQEGVVPAAFVLNPTGVLALIAAVLVWFSGNIWRWRRREL
ncbi:hypothetical protein ABI59_03310 [Acidobacteria bacterium Mor1]|nr:hypothetical protein ABI59_03310 [Acidobacteria bacterium Mor1]